MLFYTLLHFCLIFAPFAQHIMMWKVIFFMVYIIFWFYVPYFNSNSVLVQGEARMGRRFDLNTCSPCPHILFGVGTGSKISSIYPISISYSLIFTIINIKIKTKRNISHLGLWLSVQSLLLLLLWISSLSICVDSSFPSKRSWLRLSFLLAVNKAILSHILPLS